MKILGFLACVAGSIMFVRTEVMWLAVSENLTFGHNLLNLFLSWVCGSILLRIWFLGITTRFKVFKFVTKREEK